MKFYRSLHFNTHICTHTNLTTSMFARTLFIPFLPLKTVASGKSFADCVEMIDIGGPTMIRAAAKNCGSVAVLTNPHSYAQLVSELQQHGGLTGAFRCELARQAFVAVTVYDAAIADYFSQETGITTSVTRCYAQERELKYGVNPHQKSAALCRLAGTDMPFTVINGAPGYTNLMDALNAWQLVCELEAALQLPAAASFKHVSPAGAAVAVPLQEDLIDTYSVAGKPLSPQAVAYVRARNADPMSSFGDFVAISGVVDLTLAELLKIEVSDGIIAAGYEDDALAVLQAKKGGKYIILQGNTSFLAPEMEYKEVYGVALGQKRNDAAITSQVLEKVVTTTPLSQEATRDLLVATIAVKYTQSNSVCYARDGQVVGVGAGQQSRVDCVKLAGRKVDVWHMRQHPKVRGLSFKQGVKRPDKVNARVAYIADDMTPAEHEHWLENFTTAPEPLTPEERSAWMAKLTDVSLSSDAFFPFRDNIDQVGGRHPHAVSTRSHLTFFALNLFFALHKITCCAPALCGGISRMACASMAPFSAPSMVLSTLSSRAVALPTTRSSVLAMDMALQWLSPVYAYSIISLAV